MAKHQRSLAAEAAGHACYRITADGKAAAARFDAPLRSRYLIDQLDLLSMSGGGIAEPQLRQFMPPASLDAAISILLDLGMIEAGRAPPGS
jgi:hypothetical protein